MNPCVITAPLNINVFAGFMHDVFICMTATANEKKVPESGRQVGIIFNEMSIQRDLQLNSRAGETRLSGSVNMGKEGNDLDRCHGVHEKNGKTNNTILAANVLQMECLGFSGFVFPFAHFATVGVQAHHLMCLFWKAIGYLYDYGFHVQFLLIRWGQRQAVIPEAVVSSTETL